MTKNTAFVDNLVREEFITNEEGKRLLWDFKGDMPGILNHLVNQGRFGKGDLGRMWGDTMNVSFVDLTKTIIQHHAVDLIPEKTAREHKVIGLYDFGGVLTLACAQPANMFLLKTIEKVAGVPVNPVFAFPKDILDAIEIEYRSTDVLKELSAKISFDEFFREGGDEITADVLETIAGDKAVIEFTESLLMLAVKERVSDIHIEPGLKEVRIRFRIDGVLHERLKLEKNMLYSIASRLKILADLDLTERRRPQDGRISLALSNRIINFRFASIPTIYGEKFTLRILGQSGMKDVPDLPDLLFSKVNYTGMRKLIDTPNGIFFVTGPTGSGKTTSLYAALKHLNRPGVNIMTIEDPVEYRLPGINQIQVNPDISFDFASRAQVVPPARSRCHPRG